MPLLTLDSVVAGYGQIMAIKGISLEVDEGDIVALIGSNGAGKSTTINTISGLIRPRSGTITFDGVDIARVPPHKIVDAGISQVPEGRGIFGRLSVLENLEMGAYRRGGNVDLEEDLDKAFAPKGLLPGKTFVHDAAEREEIGASIEPHLTARLLG